MESQILVAGDANLIYKHRHLQENSLPFFFV